MELQPGLGLALIAAASQSQCPGKEQASEPDRYVVCTPYCALLYIFGGVPLKCRAIHAPACGERDHRRRRRGVPVTLSMWGM